MKLSTKGRYAMVALADIALQSSDRLVTLGEISERQDVSLPYLEQLFVKLRRAELVSSVRRTGRRVSSCASRVGNPCGRNFGSSGRNGRCFAERGRGLWCVFRQPGAIPDQPPLGKGLSAHVYVFLHQTRPV